MAPYVPRQRYRSSRTRTPRPKGKRRSFFAAIQADHIDYKDLSTIGRYITQFSRIQPRRYTGNTVRHQKMLATAIKRARYMALLPYTLEHKQFRQEE